MSNDIPWGQSLISEVHDLSNQSDQLVEQARLFIFHGRLASL